MMNDFYDWIVNSNTKDCLSTKAIYNLLNRKSLNYTFCNVF